MSNEFDTNESWGTLMSENMPMGRDPLDDSRELGEDIIKLATTSKIAFSDLIIAEDQLVVAKTPRGWITLPIDVFTPANREDFLSFFSTINPDYEQLFARKKAINRAYDFTENRIRINGFRAMAGDTYNVAVRRVLRKPPTLRDIGLEHVAMMINNTRGLVLVTGPTGSGKSTTLAAMVDHINETRHAHVLTLEDPIEYKFTRKKAIFSQREVGVDIDNFADGIEEGLRQSPDVIMIGEIRDVKTAEQVLRASESGVLVLTTIHANTPPGVVEKLLNLFPDTQQNARRDTLNKKLLGVISQTLIPSVDGDSWVLAPELLFNHTLQHGEKISSPPAIEKLMADGEAPTMTLHQSLVKLVREKKIMPADALQAIPNELARKKLSDELKTIKE